MKESSLKKYESLLLKKKKEMLEQMGKVGEAHVNATPKESSGDLSSHAYHMADQGTDQMNREMAFSRASKSGRLIHHIDLALIRLKDGSYGKCAQCGKSIGVARLEAVPHARLCINCKSSEEESKPRETKPHR